MCRDEMIMYVRYLRKTIFLWLLKVVKRLDYTGRIPDKDEQLRGYEGCYPIRNVMDKLPITNQDAILDIGCGKGLFLYYALKYSFSMIDGIERSPVYAKIAKRNANIIGDGRMHIHNVDAREFNGFENYTYYFFNNPFGAELMMQIAAIIKESALACRKKITVIYQFPFSKAAFVKIGFTCVYEKFPNALLIFDGRF